MESVIFLASLVVKKYSLFDPLVEKNNTSEAAWAVAFLISAGCCLERNFISFIAGTDLEEFWRQYQPQILEVRVY